VVRLSQLDKPVVVFFGDTVKDQGAMFQENEFISCILMVGVVLFVLVNYRAVVRIPRRNVLLSALLFFLLSDIFTIAEGFWLEAVFNALEHICYAASLLFLAVWCRLIYYHKDSGDV